MSDPEAKNILVQKTVSEWNRYNKQNYDSTTDLALEEFRGDLSQRTFINCNFKGSVFQSANLDDCRFENCLFNQTTFNNSSLVNTIFEGCQLGNSNWNDSVLRNTVVSNSNSSQLFVSGGSLEKVYFDNITAENILVKRTSCPVLKFQNSKISKLFIADSTNTELRISKVFFSLFSINNADFKVLRLDEVVIEEGSFNSKTKVTNGTIIKSEFSRVNFSGESVFTQNTFLQCLVSSTDLNHFGINDSVFIDVTFINCNWPNQQGKTSILGKYISNDNLLKQPVQDIKGISPTLRREIADAQYVRHLQESVKNKPIQKFGVQLWGLTSNFGQSVVRIFILSIFVVLCHGILFALGLSITNWPENPEFISISFRSDWLLQGIKQSFLTFINIVSFPDGKELMGGWGERVVLISCRMFGFAVLGVWISMVANRLTKLSA